MDRGKIFLVKWENLRIVKGKVCFVVCKGIVVMKRYNGEMRWVKIMEGLECCIKEIGFILYLFLR